MFLNIVTPCCRPENLHIISETITIPKENYRWIVIFDMDEFPDNKYIPNNCEVFLHRNINSVVGHSQRNFALDIIHNGHIYQNDDDTGIHPNLWENIKDLDDFDFISFAQMDGDLECIRLYGNEIRVEKMDSHNFIVSKDLVGSSRFKIDRYDADGIFALECFRKSKFPKYIPEVLSVYNWLKVQNIFK